MNKTKLITIITVVVIAIVGVGAAHDFASVASLSAKGSTSGGAERPSEAAKTASTMWTYPVQRHRLPPMALRTSSSLGCGFRASNALAERIIPGVQYPHWTAP